MKVAQEAVLRLEQHLLAGSSIPTEFHPLLLEVVRHYLSCRHRRGARPSSERRTKKHKKAAVKRQAPGHGRLGASDYPGAEHVACLHPELKAGGACPTPGCQGRLHRFRRGDDVVLSGAAPIQAMVYEREVLRCGTCDQTFTAPLPAGVPESKFHPSADAVMSVMRYGMGTPHHRLSQWQKWSGVPLAPSTQFERAEKLANAVHPAIRHCEKLAANHEVVFGDDTGVRILELKPDNRAIEPGERTGMYTSGFVSRGLNRSQPAVALYVSGRRHAGENLDRLLEQRAATQPEVIHMADAASRDPRYSQRIVARCLAHARRHFLEAQEAFPDQCEHVLDLIGRVYHHDEQTHGMDPAARLAHHQQHSAPVMNALREWMEAQLRDRLVEPNSRLGRAFAYVNRHWVGLTCFLRVPGAPLDNNTVERELRTAVRHRKNSLFYKTQAGAAVGDVLMSAIRTCVLNQVDPVHYLTAVGAHAAQVRGAPEAWLPWTYKQTLAALN
jgi:transposase